MKVVTWILEKERKPREISKEQGDLAAHWTEEREGEEKIQEAANIFGFEGLEGCWWRWSPGKGAEWKRDKQ